MKSDRKLTILFFLICSAVAGTLASINYFSVVGRAIVKGLPVEPSGGLNVVKSFEIRDQSNLNIGNISLAKYETIKDNSIGKMLSIEFDSESDLSAFVSEIEVNTSKFNISIDIIPRIYKKLGTNLTLVLATRDKYYTHNYTVEDLIRAIYGKEVTLEYKYNNNNYDFKIINYTFCEPEDEICKLTDNLDKSLGYNSWFTIILVTDGPGDNKEVTWDVFIKVWS